MAPSSLGQTPNLSQHWAPPSLAIQMMFHFPFFGPAAQVMAAEVWEDGLC